MGVKARRRFSLEIRLPEGGLLAPKLDGRRSLVVLPLEASWPP